MQRCIDSIREQSFKDFEYLIIDGCSSDDTIDVVKNNSEIVDYCASESDDGLYFAMNKGLALARGRFIGILNSDDFYEPDTLEKVKETILANPDTSIVYGAMRYRSDLNSKHFIDFTELDKKMIFHPTCFVSNSTYHRVGTFNTKYKIAGDYEFVMRCRKSDEKFVGIQDILATFSEGGESAKYKFKSVIETTKVHLKYSNESVIKIVVRSLYVLISIYIKLTLVNLHSRLNNSKGK